MTALKVRSSKSSKRGYPDCVRRLRLSVGRLKKRTVDSQKIEKLKYQVLFLEGTHDNLDLIAQYPLEEWNGGKVRRISKSVLKLERGSVFTIEGKRLFVFGGGESPEMDLRTADGTWWPQELPTIEEVMLAREELAKYDNQVDCIVTHECSSTVRHFIDMDGEHTNIMTHFLMRLPKRFRLKNGSLDATTWIR